MIYGHVTNGVVDSVGMPPATAYDGERWWDLRTLDPEALAATDWYPVTETPKPADTATTFYQVSYVFDGVGVMQTWTEFPKSQEQMDQDAANANKSTIETNLEQDLESMQAVIDQTNEELRADPSQEIKDIARAARRLIRMAIDDYSGTE